MYIEANLVPRFLLVYVVSFLSDQGPRSEYLLILTGRSPELDAGINLL